MDEIIKSLRTSRTKSKKDISEQELTNLFINDDNKKFVFIRDLVVPSLLYLQITGIENIKKCYYQQENGNWYITTKGSNLKQILKHPLVNIETTNSNHLWDIFEVFGIEAVRHFLKAEFQRLLPITSRHLDLLVNAMTYSSKPQAVTRYGIDRKQVGPLAKVAFEQPFDNFFHAATIGEKEDIKGNSASILFGRKPMMGTGYSQIIDKNNKQNLVDDKLIYDFMKKFQSQIPIKNVSNNTKRILPVNTTEKHSQLKQNIFENDLNDFKSISNKQLNNKSIYRSSLNLVKTTNKSTSNNGNTVTRIIMDAKQKEPELKLLNVPTNLVFQSKNGEVIENEEEIAY